MRLPLIPNVESRDGITNKGGRLTNALREQNAAGEMMISRPGLVLQEQSSGAGYGIVSFNDELISVYGATIGVADTEVANIVFGEATSIATLAHGATELNVLMDVSAGGSVRGYADSLAVGYAYVDDGDGGYEYRAWRWTQTTKQELLPKISGLDSTNYQAFLISGDGQSIFGVCEDSDDVTVAWRWKNDTTTRIFPDPGTTLGGHVNNCSFDGQYLVGSQDDGAGTREIVVWDIVNGAVTVHASPTSKDALKFVSDDGRYVAATITSGGTVLLWVRSTADPTTGTAVYVGGSTYELVGASSDCTTLLLRKDLADPNSEIYRWVKNTGDNDGTFTLIGESAIWRTASDDFEYRNNPISADGTTVVLIKQHPISGDREAFRWTALTGFVSISANDELMLVINENGSAITGAVTDLSANDTDDMPTWNAEDDVVYYPTPTGYNVRSVEGEGFLRLPRMSRDGFTIGGNLIDPITSDVVPFILGGREVLGRRKQISAIEEQFYDFAQSTI